MPAGDDYPQNRPALLTMPTPMFLASSYYKDEYLAYEFERNPRLDKSGNESMNHCLIYELLWRDYTLKGKARSAGISAGEFLRECMRSCHVKERLTSEHTDYVRKLCGMANNLNQLAHKANAAGFVTVRMECRVLVARIEELLNLILL